MNHENDLLHQPGTIQQHPTRSFKLRKLLTIFAAVLLMALVSGLGGYLSGISTNQNTSQSIQRVSFQSPPTIVAQPSVFTPLPIPTQTTVPMDWKTYMNIEFGIVFNYPADWGVSLPYRYESSTQQGLIADIKMGQTNVGSAVYIYILSGNTDTESFINDMFKGLWNNLPLSKKIINTSPYTVTEYIITPAYSSPPTNIPLPTNLLPDPKPLRLVGIERPANPIKVLIWNIRTTDKVISDIASSFKFTQ